jgi:uncharacterized protein (DUF1501 family)
VGGCVQGIFRRDESYKGTWDGVTLIQTSDFARTLNPNTGRGSDHGWYDCVVVLIFSCLVLVSQLSFYLPSVLSRGGNYIMMGGGVEGGQIVGSYPDNLTDDGELSVGRG